MNASFGKPKPIAAISATTWRKEQIYLKTLDRLHNEGCYQHKQQYQLTSIADIILCPQESMVSFHSGKPSGMTGSELSS